MAADVDFISICHVMVNWLDFVTHCQKLNREIQWDVQSKQLLFEMRLWENTSATLHAESDTENFKESEREPPNIAGPKIARKLLKLNGCLTKRTCCLAGLSNEKISHNSIRGNAKKSNWQWTSAYTAAITFNFFSHLQHYVCPSVRKFNLLGTTFS